MKPFSEMKYHDLAESCVSILQDKTQREDRMFFRLMIGYYFSLAASQMRCSLKSADRGEIPVNMYVVNLAPSGYGKTMAMNIVEGELLGQFRDRFLNETFRGLAETNLAKLALKRSNRNSSDPDEELKRLTNEYESTGEMMFSFDSGTGPAMKQLRHKLLLADAGSLNMVMDEVGANISANTELFTVMIELYDKGMGKSKLIKNTAENKRSEEIVGQTPTNLLAFGVASRLLDGGKTEEEFITMLNTGYARRCFFGSVRTATSKSGRTAEQMYLDRTNQSNNATVQMIADRLDLLADMSNANKVLILSRESSIYLNEYQINCEERAELLPEHHEILRRELCERYFKVLKLAGAYAFMDDASEVSIEHLENAIKLAEDSGEALGRIMTREKPWARLARYIAAEGRELTQADLAELPFYKGGTGVKNEMMTLAIAHGYSNSIIIKKAFRDGIEFLRGETLKATDLNKMVVSYSDDLAFNYTSDYAPFDKLHQLCTLPDMHWINHHLTDGHRQEDSAIAGFNLLVLDVDGGTSLEVVRELLKDYKYLLHTTKRHTEDEHRFRIILPTNYELKLDAKDFKEFMANVLSWVPFEIDDQTFQRARKWATHAGHYEYNDGVLLDVLPFIPRTTKNEERKAKLVSQQDLGNLERWVMNNIGDGNRNVMLHRYGMLLVDNGMGYDDIARAVLSLNEKIADKLDEAEIMTTVMTTVSRELAKR